MSRNTTSSFGQPSLEDLMVRFLASRSDAAATAVESGEGDVEPHEVAAGFRVDPSAAWNDATCLLTAAAGPQPPEWAALVNQHASAYALPMAVGNFPQRVRDLHSLIACFHPDELRPSLDAPPLPGLSSLRAWISRQGATWLAAGLARMIGDFAAAETLLAGDDSNEYAALLWHSGRCEEALEAWTSLPETPSVLFNRGMALLFLGRLAEARPVLAKAIAGLPETSGWNALARLYLAVAEINCS